MTHKGKASSFTASDVSQLMMLALYALLIAALLLLTVAGARLYASAVAAQTENARQRSALSFIQTQLAASAGEAYIHVEEGSEGDILRISEPDGSFETAVYVYDGTLCTQMLAAGAVLSPENGEQICSMNSLSVCWESGGLLRIEADGRSAWAYCGGGAEIGKP